MTDRSTADNSTSHDSSAQDSMSQDSTADNSALPIHFVICAPRSGSTWLARALNGHPEVFATEHRLFGNFAEIWRNNDGSSSPRLTLDSYARAMATHYFHDELGLNHGQFIDVFQKAFVNFMISFARRRSGAKVVIDKITPYPGTAAFVVAQIQKFFPDSKIILLTRDGRDVLTSGTFDWLKKDAQGTDRYRFFVDREPGFRLGRFFDDDVIAKWAGNWRETIEIRAKIRAKIRAEIRAKIRTEIEAEIEADSGPEVSGSGNDVRICYESMKSNQAAELQKVFAAVGVRADLETAIACAKAVTFEKTTGRTAGSDNSPTDKARKGIVGDWKNYFTRQDGRLFHELAGPQLVQCGYATDDHWFEKLPEQLSLEQP